MDAMDLERVRLVGHDWRGWTGFLACLKAPEWFQGFVALGIVHPFQCATPKRLVQAWRGSYQVALSTSVLAEYALRSSRWFVATALSLAAVRREAIPGDVREMYGRTIQQPDRARATVQMYRTFWTSVDISTRDSRFPRN